MSAEIGSGPFHRLRRRGRGASRVELASRSLAVVACAVAAAGCASSASLVQQGDLAGACREARDEKPDEQVELRERLLAEVAPKVAIRIVDPETTATLRDLVGNRYTEPRFARVAVELAPGAAFQAQLQLVGIHDQRARYRVGHVDELLAADLVLSRPEGDLADAARLLWLALETSAVLVLSSACAVAQAPADCMGSWSESDAAKMRRTLAQVDADPELRRRKDELLATARAGDPLVVLVPLSTPAPAARPVQLSLLLRARFEDEGEPCSHQLRIVVELEGEDLDQAIARHFAGRSRALLDLRPRLEWEPPPIDR